MNIFVVLVTSGGEMHSPWQLWRIQTDPSHPQTSHSRLLFLILKKMNTDVEHLVNVNAIVIHLLNIILYIIIYYLNIYEPTSSHLENVLKAF